LKGSKFFFFFFFRTNFFQIVCRSQAFVTLICDGKLKNNVAETGNGTKYVHLTTHGAVAAVAKHAEGKVEKKKKVGRGQCDTNDCVVDVAAFERVDLFVIDDFSFVVIARRRQCHRCEHIGLYYSVDTVVIGVQIFNDLEWKAVGSMCCKS
jgi:hypothetical protein